MVGNAVHQQTGNVVLTQDSGGQIGGMWNACTLNLTQNFDITWDLNFGGNAYGCGADGMAFALQKNGTGALGADSGEHGYDNGGINSGIAVYMDTWTNAVAPYNDPAYQSLGVNVNGAPGDAVNGGTITGPARPPLLPANAPITDALNHTVEFIWTVSGVNGTMQVKVDGNLQATYVFNNFATNWFGGNASAVTWGMTASTGGSYNLQQAGVDSVSTINGTAVTSATVCAISTPTVNTTPAVTVTPMACTVPTPAAATCAVGITADGNLTEPIYSTGTWYNDTHVSAGSATGTNAAQFQTYWDSSYLYLSVNITKTGTLYTTATQANYWKDDSIDLYWNESDSHAGGFGSKDGQFTFEYGQSGIFLNNPSGGLSTAGIVYGYQAVTGGWTAEIKIPWADLGVATPTAGNVFGMDTDVNFASAQDNRVEQLTWFNSVDGNDYSSTTHYGNLDLGAACSPSATPTFTVSPSITPTFTNSPVLSPTPSRTATFTALPTNTFTASPTYTATATYTLTSTPAPTTCGTPQFQYSDKLASAQDGNNTASATFTLAHGA
ncbi:MAG TPA: sugar-binding protein, partial [bacterium]|nr:sugar-binding protein [bacterium]